MAQELLRDKKIKSFRSLFEYIPYDIIAREMKMGNSRFLGLLREPKNLKMEQVYRLAEILNYDAVKLTTMTTKVVNKEWDSAAARSLRGTSQLD